MLTRPAAGVGPGWKLMTALAVRVLAPYQVRRGALERIRTFDLPFGRGRS